MYLEIRMLQKSMRSSITANLILIFQKNWIMSTLYQLHMNVVLYFLCRVDHFGNSNMQEWLHEHKDEVVGNIEEEVLDGAGLIKEVATGHRDVDEVNDEEDNGEEDEGADDDEDGHGNPYFFKKDNGLQFYMGENTGVGKLLEEDMGDNEDVYPNLPNIFNDKMSVRLLREEVKTTFGIDVSMS
uniref:Uncharacterized protein n=1 Tax=Lactuca sativa TaxID=4236 RepID=A0A9R1W740_LACSA|nr:hypothetical protein LSAT_V11C300134140 [Lactuca sativa]